MAAGATIHQVATVNEKSNDPDGYTVTAGSGIVTTTSAPSIEAGAEKSIRISFTGSAWKNADTYSDTIAVRQVVDNSRCPLSSGLR